MGWQTSNRVMKIRKKSRIVDVFVEMLDGWRRHLSGRNASLLSFFAFLSIFPLMLAATTILGIVLSGNDQLRMDFIENTADNIPVLGTQLKETGELSGSVWVLIGGLLGAIWSSMKAFVGLQGALDDVWEVPLERRNKLPKQRGRALVGLLIIGAAQVGSLAIATVIAAADLAGISNIALIAGTVAINVLVLMAMFRFLTSEQVSFRDVLPGSIVAGLVFTVLQHFGPAIVIRIQDNAGDTYGTFAIVIALVTWLSLVSITAIMSAELSAAMVRLGDNPRDVHDLGAEFDLSVR